MMRNFACCFFVVIDSRTTSHIESVVQSANIFSLGAALVVNMPFNACHFFPNDCKCSGPVEHQTIKLFFILNLMLRRFSALCVREPSHARKKDSFLPILTVAFLLSGCSAKRIFCASANLLRFVFRS